jgi:excisionase family DNA binding protein
MRLAEAAETLGISHNTLRRWSDVGCLTCYRSPGGHRRYRRADVEAALRGLRGVAPEGLREPGAMSEHLDVGAQDSALRALAAVAAQGAGATSCCIAVRDGDDVLRVVAVHDAEGGSTGIGARVSLSSHPAEAEVLLSRRRLVVPDVAATLLLDEAAAEDYRRRGLRAFLIVPVMRDNRPEGIFRLGHAHGPRSFDAPTVTFAEFMARYAGLLLSGEQAGFDRHPEAGSPVDDDLATPEPSPAGEAPADHAGRYAAGAGAPDATQVWSAEEGLRMVALAAVTALSGHPGVSFCATHTLVDGRFSVLASAAPWNLQQEWRLDRFSVASSTVGRGETHVVAVSDPSVDPEVRQRLEAHGLTAVALAPVALRGRIVGLLSATGSDAEALRAAIPAMEATADLVAAALREADEAARLERRARDLDLLSETWRMDIAGMDLDKVLRMVAQRLAVATGSPIAEVYVIEGDSARALVSYDGGRWDEAWEDVVLPLARYPTNRQALASGSAVLICSLEDAHLDPEARLSLEKWGYQSHLCLPLLSGGRAIGILELYDYVPHDFGPDLELVRGLAQVATHALAWERLTEQVRHRDGSLDELLEIGRICAAASDPDSLARQVAERLRSAVDAGSCDIFRVTTEGVRCVASHDRSGSDEEAVGRVLDLALYPTTVAATNAHEVLMITSPDDPRLSSTERETYREYGYASEVCVPLVAQDRLIGFIDICDTRARGYADYLSFLRNVAHTVSVALDSMQLRDQLERLLVDDLERRSARLEELAGAEAPTSPPAGAARSGQAPQAVRKEHR